MPRKKKVEELPEAQVEEVVKIQEEKEDKKERVYTEEEKNKLDEFYDAIIKRHLRPRVWEVSHYMDQTHKKLDDLYNDINNKVSGLSALNRSFLTSFERDYINNLFDKRYL